MYGSNLWSQGFSKEFFNPTSRGDRNLGPCDEKAKAPKGLDIGVAAMFGEAVPNIALANIYRRGVLTAVPNYVDTF